VTGKNSGNIWGPAARRFTSTIIVEPPGCAIDPERGRLRERGAQYSLPDARIGANRDLDGVRKVILDAVVQAQGKGCSPGSWACASGATRHRYLHSKEQLLRTLDDVNPDPPLAALEQDVVQTGNKLGIGPMGFGGNDAPGLQGRRAQTGCRRASSCRSRTCAGPTAARASCWTVRERSQVALLAGRGPQEAQDAQGVRSRAARGQHHVSCLC